MRKEQRELVELAAQLGFTYVGLDGSGHIELRHDGSGERVILPSTPSEYRGRLNAIALLERVAGRKLPRAKHGRSRKQGTSSGFSVESARRELNGWHGTHDDDVQRLIEQREQAIERCRDLATRRNSLRAIPPLLSRIAHIEQRLRDLAQPVETFDPFTLSETE